MEAEYRLSQRREICSNYGIVRIRKSRITESPLYLRFSLRMLYFFNKNLTSVYHERILKFIRLTAHITKTLGNLLLWKFCENVVFPSQDIR